MVWDLGKAMRKKEEFESARLMDFEFRQRARAMRLLAARLGRDETELAKLTVEASDDAILDRLVTAQYARGELDCLWHECLAEARRALIEERGDPTPYRLG